MSCLQRRCKAKFSWVTRVKNLAAHSLHASFRHMNVESEAPKLAGRGQKFWRLPQVRYVAASVVAILLGAWCIYPFVNLKTDPAFNSDTALVLTAAAERVPLAETLFTWGTARSGSAFVILGAIYFRIFGGAPLINFLSILNAVVVVLGCCVFLETREKDRRQPCLLLLPAGLLLVAANFNLMPSSVTFAFTITDLGHRPELMALLAFQSWLFLSLERFRPLQQSEWWARALPALVISVIATWVSDLALIAGFLFASVTIVRAFCLKLRRPWETLAIWLGSGLSLLTLRRFSAHGSVETRQLFKFPESEKIREMLGGALQNLFSNLSWPTWMAIALLGLSLGGWAMARLARDGVVPRQRTFWQAVNLLIVGAAALLIPFFNNWVFDNGAHPRYFSPGALLLCVGASQGAVFLLREALPRRGILVAPVLTLLLLPLIFHGAQVVRVRHDLVTAGKSQWYRASEQLMDAMVRGVIGPYWDSYAYVLARPGWLKATPEEGHWDRSVSNTMTVLSMPCFAWIARTPGLLQPVMHTRGLELTEVNPEPPKQLATGAWFKTYKPGFLRVKFGESNTRIYLREGWSGDERDESHSWVWAIGRRAVMEVPLAGGERYLMELKATSIGKPGQRQEMAVSVDGRSLGTLPFDEAGRLEQALSLPPTSNGSRKRRIEFDFAYAVSPKSLDQNSIDDRNLAVSFERADFSRERTD